MPHQAFMIPPMSPDMHGMMYPGNGYMPHYYYDYSMGGEFPFKQ